jgi:arginine/lysine/ornithine decarboxylase
MNQNKKPLYEKLAAHEKKSVYSFHVPGHKYGNLIPKDASRYFQQMLKLDATELSGLDDLHSPEGVIMEAEELLAQLHHVKRSYFLVNGSTVGNLAMIMAAVKENEKILVQRNCHKSVLNGIRLAGAVPILLGPELNEEWGIASGVSVQTVSQAIELYPDAKAIILTYPNYYGMVYDLQGIARLCHEKGIPVLVDEAHGAHFIAGDCFPKSSVELGGDLVVQSAHKTLPAMTMGAYLHYNTNFIRKEAVESYLQMLQSSSPSYPLMASLDIARGYLATFTREDGEYLLKKITEFKDRLQQLKGIKVLSYKNGEGDPLKITLQSASALSGFEIQKLLEDEGIYTEMADPNNVLLVFPLLKKGMDFPLTEVTAAFKKALHALASFKTAKVNFALAHQGISKLEINIKNQGNLESRLVPLDTASGKVCAEFIIPYPPGIPLLFPGEVISQESIEQIKLLRETGARFQGGKNLLQGKISIY